MKEVTDAKGEATISVEQETVVTEEKASETEQDTAEPEDDGHEKSDDAVENMLIGWDLGNPFEVTEDWILPSTTQQQATKEIILCGLF